MPIMHPREKLVTNAEQVLRKACLKVSDGLTTAEYLRVVTSVLSDEVQGMLKLMIRQERHPDNPDKPGGWA